MTPKTFSLGNMVFDGAPTTAQWNAGNLLELNFTARNRSPGLRLVPVRLDRRGWPQLVSPNETSAH